MNPALLRNLYETTEYLLLLEELKKDRPIVPIYDWVKDNIEEIKAKSNQQQGYDRAMSKLILNGDSK